MEELGNTEIRGPRELGAVNNLFFGEKRGSKREANDGTKPPHPIISNIALAALQHDQVRHITLHIVI